MSMYIYTPICLYIYIYLTTGYRSFLRKPRFSPLSQPSVTGSENEQNTREKEKEMIWSGELRELFDGEGFILEADETLEGHH